MNGELQAIKAKISEYLHVIQIHYEKIQDEPDATPVPHWKREIAGHVKTIAGRLKRLKRKYSRTIFTEEVENVKLCLSIEDAELLDRLLNE